MGFEPTRAKPNGLAVHRLNHSATSSQLKKTEISTVLEYGKSFSNLAAVWIYQTHSYFISTCASYALVVIHYHSLHNIST